ncbi:hypothetical protein K0M31_000264 [Melipona bicolor]|uniref:Uncharacterized protein n=1 Tax=Melipona bicolor TaxID=60889 RepID=A0AA40KWH2_9HYME|nr:hypothetical protein K0M31_000264 [Melipona bicolor]
MVLYRANRITFETGSVDVRDGGDACGAASFIINATKPIDFEAVPNSLIDKFVGGSSGLLLAPLTLC